MTTVFLLVIYLGDAVQQSDMHFRDINRCRYFANRISKQLNFYNLEHSKICLDIFLTFSTNTPVCLGPNFGVFEAEWQR